MPFEAYTQLFSLFMIPPTPTKIDSSSVYTSLDLQALYPDNQAVVKHVTSPTAGDGLVVIRAL